MPLACRKSGGLTGARLAAPRRSTKPSKSKTSGRGMTWQKSRTNFKDVQRFFLMVLWCLKCRAFIMPVDFCIHLYTVYATQECLRWSLHYAEPHQMWCLSLVLPLKALVTARRIAFIPNKSQVFSTWRTEENWTTLTRNSRRLSRIGSEVCKLNFNQIHIPHYTAISIAEKITPVFH